MTDAALSSKKTRLASDGTFETDLTASDQALQFLFAYVGDVDSGKIKVEKVVKYAIPFSLILVLRLIQVM